MGNYGGYILTNPGKTVLYVGMTNDLRRRLGEHAAGLGSEFTGRYHLRKLVYYEHTTDVESAIRREKQIKRWSRAKKGRLVETRNPHWDDLAATPMD